MASCATATLPADQGLDWRGRGEGFSFAHLSGTGNIGPTASSGEATFNPPDSDGRRGQALAAGWVLAGVSDIGNGSISLRLFSALAAAVIGAAVVDDGEGVLEGVAHVWPKRQ